MTIALKAATHSIPIVAIIGDLVARWSGGNNVKLREYAEELVAPALDVILAGGSQ